MLNARKRSTTASKGVPFSHVQRAREAWWAWSRCRPASRARAARSRTCREAGIERARVVGVPDGEQGIHRLPPTGSFCRMLMPQPDCVGVPPHVGVVGRRRDLRAGLEGGRAARRPAGCSNFIRSPRGGTRLTAGHATLQLLWDFGDRNSIAAPGPAAAGGRRGPCYPEIGQCSDPQTRRHGSRPPRLHADRRPRPPRPQPRRGRGFPRLARDPRQGAPDPPRDGLHPRARAPAHRGRARASARRRCRRRSRGCWASTTSASSSPRTCCRRT